MKLKDKEYIQFCVTQAIKNGHYWPISDNTRPMFLNNYYDRLNLKDDEK